MMRLTTCASTIAVCTLGVLATACGSSANGETTSSNGETTAQQTSAMSQDCRARQFLSLGDSIAFGFSPLVNPNDTDDFVGYPEVVALRTEEVVFNSACPGETSGSFLDTSAPDNGCQAFRAHFPLHVSYSGSQMSYAVDFLSSQPANFITINLGANDLFLLQHECAGVPACIEAGLSAVLQQFGQNVATIYTNIVHTGFHKQLIALTTYSTNYNDPLVTGAVSAIDAVLVQVTNQFGFTVADGFGAFKQASEPSLDPCAAGLLIKLPDGTCNVHPSKLGREVLAGAILRVLRVNEGGNDQGENMQACQGQQ